MSLSKNSSQEATKKLINSPESSVDDNLRGLATVYPQLRLHAQSRVVTTAQDAVSAKVAVLSGGGSGHEPFVAGYVGHGMLSGAVCGGIFTSPPPSHVLHAITHLHRYHQGGVFVVIPNYTGDRLNFGMAIEKARNAGLKIEFIVIDEDLASGENSCTGARGMVGLVCIYKILGALAAEGASLSELQSTATLVLKNMATFGVSLRACSLPGQAPLFEVSADEMELGTGVHGEAGVSRHKLGTAREVCTLLLTRLANKLALEPECRVVVSVNNMGATTNLEMNIVCAEVADYFKNRSITVERLYGGHLMTCLDMHGFQINVILLPTDTSICVLLLRLLDASTDAPAWPGGRMSLPSATKSVMDDEVELTLHSEEVVGPELTAELRGVFRTCLVVAAHALIMQEDVLNRLDAGCGDGDCGSTLRNLAEGVMKLSQKESFANPARVLAELSEIAESEMGGTSGGIYSLGFSAAARVIAQEPTVTPVTWSRAWSEANAAITKYGRANPGERTMVDALVPAADAFAKHTEAANWASILDATRLAAHEGAKSTAAMKARAGRASYVGEAHLGGEDAGARGAAVWIHAIMSALLEHTSS